MASTDGSGPESAARPAAQAQARILVFVPMYQCERQIPLVIARIGRHLGGRVEAVLVVDNGSRDRSRERAAAALARLDIPATLVRNEGNFNLGGSHKVAFAHARDHGFDWVVVVHGDDQADPADLVPWLDGGALHDGVDAVLGARFGRGSRRSGYAWHRTLGNLAFNALYSAVCGVRVRDLGSGLNAFRVGWLRTHAWANLADDLTFNIHLLLRLVHDRARVRFLPISWREEGQVSNVRLVRQTARTFAIAWGYLWGGGAYLARGHAGLAPEAYRSRVEYRNAGAAGMETVAAAG
jgi:glycosyltransferase involved in cell wall biosynthesis